MGILFGSVMAFVLIYLWSIFFGWTRHFDILAQGYQKLHQKTTATDLELFMAYLDWRFPDNGGWDLEYLKKSSRLYARKEEWKQDLMLNYSKSGFQMRFNLPTLALICLAITHDEVFYSRGPEELYRMLKRRAFQKGYGEFV